VGSAWFLEPTQVHTPNGIWIGSGVFAELKIVTERPIHQKIGIN